MVLDTLRRSASARRLPLCVSHVRARLLIDNAKVQHFACASKFYPSIWGSFQPKFDELMFSTSSLLTLGRTHASMVLHSLNRSL